MTQPFDLLGPLPAAATTTVLEASAGTGKTFALAGLVTRYLAEGRAGLDEMLLITFSRAASQELRERVRGQIARALEAFDTGIAPDDLIGQLLTGSSAELAQRRHRLRDALAGFDAATIATTHQFCHLVLKSLGVAGDDDSGVTLVESLDELVTEVVSDLYLARFGNDREDPALTYAEALTLARDVVANPSAQLRPADPIAQSRAAICLGFVSAVRTEMEKRKRSNRILGYDDLLTRLSDALEEPGSPARDRMQRRWSIVMVDEFQDTDPVQWQVIDRAFSGRCTLILIGDPKQAIYAFRGGDIETYLQAAATAGTKQTLGTNWRSDSALVERLQVVLRGAQLGDPSIVVHDVAARHSGSRLAGAPCGDPFRLRVVSRSTFGSRGTQNLAIDDLRDHIGADLAADIATLLGSAATFDGRPLAAGQLAVIVESHKDARVCHNALTQAGIASVYTGDSDVFGSEAADDWLTLLEVFDQPQRPGLVRAAAATMFFGATAATLAAGGEALTDRVGETLRIWAGYARERGVAAVLEAAQVAGMSARVLSWRGGERQLTDLAHLTQLLQEVAHREHHNLPALRDWLQRQRRERSGAAERYRRLDSDAAAVQIMTVWAAKGLQFPVVYLPFTFNRYIPDSDRILYHEDGRRCLHIGGPDDPGHRAAAAAARRESAGDDSRLTYVALTRAQSQVVAWWAPAFNEPNGGLSRILRGRRPGDAVVPDRCAPARITDDDALARLQAWEAAGGPVIEQSVVVGAAPPSVPVPATDIEVRRFDRTVDTTWQRTSYSALIRHAERTGVSSEPETTELDDEIAEIRLTQPISGPGLESPMAHLPTGATLGSLVHAVLEKTDPQAPDLAAELQLQIQRQLPWWPVDVAAPELAAALLPMHDTPLGPLAGGLTLRDIGRRDRLCEMDFEFPLAGGDLRDDVPDVRLRQVGELMAALLPADDELAPYAARLSRTTLGDQRLRGYLSGSVDAVLRIPGGRYLVVDYKTNWLGEPDRPLTAADYVRPRLLEAMLHSDYPLQALLYSVVLHRFLRWRQPRYDPAQHLGGVLYLFVRGMCGAQTPVTGGHPAGVFGWMPPPGLVTGLSDLLAAQAPS